MALKAGTAYVDVAAKVAPGFQGDVDKAITPGMDATGKKAGGILSSSFGKAAAVAGAGVLAAKGTEFLKGAVDAARESAKIAAQSEAVVKSTGGAANISADQMGKLAESISKKTAVDDEAIQSAENLLATFTNVRNEAGKGNDIFNQSTETLVDMAAALGTDVSSGAIQLGKALNDPIKGISALSRVGVTFTDQQKEQIKTMAEAGDMAGAQKVILAELAKEFGGSAAAQATGADRLAVAWGNVEEEIGGKLLPVVEKLSTWLADHSELILPLVGLIAGGLVLAFTAWAISAASAAAATIAAAAPVLAIIAVIALLAAGIFLLVKNWDEIWSKITEIAGAAWEAIKGAFSAAWSWITDMFARFWPVLLGLATGGVGLIVLAIVRNWDSIKSKTGELIGTVVRFFTELPGKILGAIGNLGSLLYEKGKQLIAGLVRGLKDAALGIPKAVGGAIGGALDKVLPGKGLNPLKMFAAGGPIGGGEPGIVGERGPELFVPRVSGGIVPTSTILDALASAGGSSGPFAGAQIAVDARGRSDDPWYLGTTLNRTLRELAYAEGWS